jgi:hypothetical protein
MIVNYSNEEVKKGGKSIFLAGPTPRDKDVLSWRPEAIKILEELGFDGTVYVPEREFDDRSFDYLKQYWWEREALHNASAIVFWIPRNVKTMPAFTTNAEYGKYTAINIDKVVYGRPDNSEKNGYFDLDYYVESEEEYSNTLADTLKRAMVIADKRKDMVDLDSYELNIIKRTMRKYPEVMELVGEVQFTPESFGEKSENTTYGAYLFSNAPKDQLKEFDRTILSVLLYHYIKDNRYEKFTELQKGPNKLTEESFNEIRKFMLENFDTKEKEDLLIYYMVINDLGKCVSVINKLKSFGIESIDHDELLTYLVQYNMLPSLNKFSDEYKTNLNNVLENGINVGQYIQGECVDYSLNKVLNLNKFEKSLMMAEAMLDIAGVLGHVNNLNGSAILNQSTTDNILLANEILATCQDKTKVFGDFLKIKADKLGVVNDNPYVRKAVVRICLMMRLFSKDDVKTVEDEIVNNLEQYKGLIYELNQTGYDNAAILPYYAPALLSNASKYYGKQGKLNPIKSALVTCLPFLQNIMRDARIKTTANNGIVTVMLRDAAMVAAENPENLNSLEVDALNDHEAVVKNR